ncbi:MAG: hypothetical protein ACI9HK_005533 [Pirellulaceae bacterium]|jgi:hypothetical protein
MSVTNASTTIHEFPDWIQTRSMASSSHSHVQLETMASPLETSARTHTTQRADSSSNTPRAQSERLLAHVQDNRQWRRTDQRVARRTRAVKHENALEPACSTRSNRPMRTRMSGGVGAGPSDGAGYPIIGRSVVALLQFRTIFRTIFRTFAFRISGVKFLQIVQYFGDLFFGVSFFLVSHLPILGFFAQPPKKSIRPITCFGVSRRRRL